MIKNIITKNFNERKLLNEKIFNNPTIPKQNKDYLKQLLRAVQVTEIFIGDPRAYSGYEVLVIAAKGNGIAGMKLEYAENFIPAADEEFFIEVGVNYEYEGAIEISNSECEPLGFVEL